MTDEDVRRAERARFLQLIEQVEKEAYGDYVHGRNPNPTKSLARLRALLREDVDE